MTAFANLMAFQRETEALSYTAERLGWDQETMMSPGSAAQRAEEMAVIEGILHARRTAPQISEWLAAAHPETDEDAAQIRHIERSYTRHSKVPAKLSQEIARVTSTAQGIWAEARAKNDVAAFLPTLSKVIALRQEEGAALADGGDAYDALIDDYEPSATAATLGDMFARMRPRITALREKILGASYQPAPLDGHFPREAQMNIARKLADAFGYDWTRGRLDLSVHPFSSGAGDDVRITTRIDERDPLNCFYSTIHEIGHACYEQNIAPRYRFTPLGRGVSMGVHESQSRIYENQLGRSRAFTGWMFAQMQTQFGDMGTQDADAFYAAVNRVRSGYIRTEADEIHYNLHVMMRFDLERALIKGDLLVRDLEAAWNDRFFADFGVRVEKPSQGMLQDVHWSAGLFGYFPTYSLGNLYAACLYDALQREVPDLAAHLARGDARPATTWLRDKVQCHGGLMRPAEIIASACGFTPNEGPLLDYLEAKFTALYRL